MTHPAHRANGVYDELQAGSYALTVNLHDWLVCLRDGVVVALRPVGARGAMW